MNPTRIALLAAPGILMMGACLLLTGIEQWTASFGTTPDAQLMLGRIGLALPYAMAAGTGVMFLFAAKGAVSIQYAGGGVLIGTIAVVIVAFTREILRLAAFVDA